MRVTRKALEPVKLGDLLVVRGKGAGRAPVGRYRGKGWVVGVALDGGKKGQLVTVLVGAGMASAD